MDQDPTLDLSEVEKEWNFIESASAISNVYVKNSPSDTRGITCEHVQEHSNTMPSSEKKAIMKRKFRRMGIELNYVVVSPHFHDFKGRHDGHNCFGAVSRTRNVAIED
jgi:hypothetical protein